ncbi:unnamed protein product [Prunus armeniaca]
MTEDMRALEKNQILELIPLPKRKKPVRCIWVFTIKRKLDGMVDKYKTRLVARGFTQTYGIDYQEETGMLDCKPVNTPIEQNHDLEESPYHTLAIKERYHSYEDSTIFKVCGKGLMFSRLDAVGLTVAQLQVVTVMFI